MVRAYWAVWDVVFVLVAFDVQGEAGTDAGRRYVGAL